MNPLALAMLGLNIALFANAMNLLGVGTEPTSEDAPDANRTVGVCSLIGATTLLGAAVWFIVGNPNGAEAQGLDALLASITSMYGFILLLFFLAQVYGFSLRPVGAVCLLAAALQVIQMIAFADLVTLDTTHAWIVEAVLATYVVLLLLFRQLIYGKVAARVVGIWALVAVAGTTYLLFYGGGIFTPPT